MVWLEIQKEPLVAWSFGTFGHWIDGYKAKFKKWREIWPEMRIVSSNFWIRDRNLWKWWKIITDWDGDWVDFSCQPVFFFVSFANAYLILSIFKKQFTNKKNRVIQVGRFTVARRKRFQGWLWMKDLRLLQLRRSSRPFFAGWNFAGSKSWNFNPEQLSWWWESVVRKIHYFSCFTPTGNSGNSGFFGGKSSDFFG